MSALAWPKVFLKSAEFMIWFRLIMRNECRGSQLNVSCSFGVASVCLSKKSGISAPEVVLEPLD
ncbi:MAG: hypothetical protein CMM07_15765 [Rhodopirellula sp.]|nr:hypothetical protein [Rhodopirellula sp.]